ncbi:MAG: hypothetical protein I8H77_17485 [Comamonadaceae bacterium]|nr:hypothetical protein [Comamonadaceae bacterium]
MLLKKLSENYELSTVDVLLKHRGEIEGSINFFKKNGVGVVSAGVGDSHFYNRLFSLLSRYRKIVGCTFSSAITLAAAIGKSVEFIENYSYEYYDVENIYDFVNYESPKAREFVLNFINASDSERTKLARNILGSDFLESPEIMRRKYLLALASSEHLLHHKRNHTFARKLLISLGEKTSRPGIVRLGAGLEGFSKSRRKIMRIKVDELSVWKNGVSPENLSFNLEDFVPGVTIPATAVSKYSEIIVEKQ